MPSIEGELQTAIEDPLTCAELADFTCGDARAHAEEVVEKIVWMLHAGEWASATLLVTREMPARTLVGVSAIDWRAVPLQSPRFPTPAYSDAVYVAVLALAERYRGKYTTKAGEPLGAYLVREALGHISAMRPRGMPPVQAFVDPANTPSINLVMAHGFEVHAEWPAELMFIRPRDLPVPTSPMGTTEPCKRVERGDPETPTS